MNGSEAYFKIITTILFCSLCWAAASIAYAQQADSTRRTFFMRPESGSSINQPHSERSMGTHSLPQSGVFEMPEETQYYTPPFKGQYYLDLAVEAYRQEQRDKLGLNWLFGFLNAIAPYVNNQFQFGVYRINDLPVVARDNPLFQSYRSREEIE